MVPVFFAAALIVPHAVLDEEKAILRSEGYFHVAGRYIASSPDADKMRRLEAERRVAERERLDRFCAWCDGKLLPGELVVEIGLRKVHKTPCAGEYDAWAYDEKASFAQAIEKGREAGKSAPPAGPGGENDPRWALVTDDTLVDFEGELTRWGDLMMQDRKTVEMRPDGSLIGGYRF